VAEATPEPAQSGTADEPSGQADGAPQRRLIRVFVSSTFVDFMEERELLAKRVFPALQRRAAVRGVELVDVDLRWGVTEAMTRNGRTLPICLAAIDRCRPYFIGMLGERYGWVPPPDPRYYQSELLEREPWLKERMGGASVTELEILHGVLRNPAMGGRAFFYLRDPAYARGRGEAGWLAESEAEQQRLDALKQQVCQSGFPVVEGLADPEAIAERIEADLWALIEEQFPEEQQPDALERENRQHAAYRSARTGEGRYIDDGGLVRQLEERLVGGDQAILIEGESGAGKSALLANWLEAHARSHPEDVVHAHHLGCSNDASALRPLLARLIENATPLLLAEQLISKAPAIPQDWWELVARVAETLYSLGRSAMKRGGRWILVLDGLDRLSEEDQQALPWLPLQLPEGVAVVVSALTCSARTILQERGYSRLMVGPLAKQAQEQLIRRYLNRYEKELEDGLRQRIQEHPQAGSPLFLRVLLEELRQCGRHDTLAAQLDGYLSAGSVDELYGKVLERLEQEASEDVQSSGDSSLTEAEAAEQRDDQAANPVRRVMSALWASRAGLSENELQAITGLTPRQWAPIELAMASAFGRNGNRHVFDHDYLRQAVECRYLPTKEQQRQAHSGLADWISFNKCRKAQYIQEILYQLVKAERLENARLIFVDLRLIPALWDAVPDHELSVTWQKIGLQGEERLDIRLQAKLTRLMRVSNLANPRIHEAVEAVGHLLGALCLEGEARIWIARLTNIARNRYSVCKMGRREDYLQQIATAYGNNEQWRKAETWMQRALESARNSSHREARRIAQLDIELAVIMIQTNREAMAAELLQSMLNELDRSGCTNAIDEENTALGVLAYAMSQANGPKDADPVFRLALKRSEEHYGKYSVEFVNILGNHGTAWAETSEPLAKEILESALQLKEAIYGPAHPSTTSSRDLLAKVLNRMGLNKDCLRLARKNLRYAEAYIGKKAKTTLEFKSHLALACENLSRSSRRESLRLIAERLYCECLSDMTANIGPDHSITNETRWFMANFLSDQERYEESIPLRRRELEVAVRRNGQASAGTITSIHRLAEDLYWNDQLQESEHLYREALNGRLATFSTNDGSTMASCYGLARCLSALGHYEEAIELRRLELAWCREKYGNSDPGTLSSINDLALDLREIGELEEAETLFQELLASCQKVLNPEDFQIGLAISELGKTIEEIGKLDQALIYVQQALEHRIAFEGSDTFCTNIARFDLARLLHKEGRNSEALARILDVQSSMARLHEQDDDDRHLLSDVEGLLHQIVMALAEER
jgi:nephrocystin-3